MDELMDDAMKERIASSISSVMFCTLRVILKGPARGPVLPSPLCTRQAGERLSLSQGFRLVQHEPRRRTLSARSPASMRATQTRVAVLGGPTQVSLV